MDDLVQWLRDLVAETRYDAERGYLHSPLEPPGGRWRPDSTAATPDPDRLPVVRLPPAVQPLIIAQCDAYDAILTRYEAAQAAAQAGQWLPSTRRRNSAYRQALSHTIRDLAVSYRHHPGYREEWRR